MYWMYILYNEFTDRYYVGSTADLDDRLKRHNLGQSKATKSGAPHWQLAYSESFPSRSEAIKREYSIKAKKSRPYIQWLIAQNKGS